MASRPLMIASLLGASIGVPYAITHTDSAEGVGSGWLFESPAASATEDQRAAALVSPEKLRIPVESPGSLIYSSPAPLEGLRVHSIEQVLRFDITKEWVYQNWARKSTGLADASLFGVRVPLVTGTGMTDLAGSLTYNFNAQNLVEHISFRGRTGDTSRLVQFLVRTYEFKPKPAPVGEQLFQVERSGRVQSELRTRTDSVLWSTSPHTSFAVELELVRPGINRFLTPRGPQMKIPPAATAAPQAASAAAGSQGIAEALLDDARYATPQERDQVLWRRWPN